MHHKRTNHFKSNFIVIKELQKITYTSWYDYYDMKDNKRGETNFPDVGGSTHYCGGYLKKGEVWERFTR